MNAQALFSHWEESRLGLYDALDKLSDGHLDFTPGPGLWTLRETILHIAGVEDGWVNYGAFRELDGWPEYAAADYPTVDSLKALLAEVHERTLARFRTGADASFASTVDLPWNARRTMAWIIWHVIEHEIHHRGEVYLMLGMQGIEAPDV